MVSINIFDQITKLYKIYYSSEKSDFNLETFNEEDFYNMIFPHLNKIIDLIKKKQKEQKEKSAFDFSKESDINLSENTDNDDENDDNKNDNNDDNKNDNNDDNNENCNDNNNVNDNNYNNDNIDNNKNGSQNNMDNINDNDNDTNKNINIDGNKMDIGNDKPNINFDNNNNGNGNNSNNKDSYFEETIKPILKKMYKKLSLICHPDKNKELKDGVIFTRIKDCYEEQMLIGMINFALQFDIDLDYIDLNQKMVNYLVMEMKKLINKILNKSYNG